MGTVERIVTTSVLSNIGSGNPVMTNTESDISTLPVIYSNTNAPNSAGLGDMFAVGSGSDQMYSNSFLTADGNFHKMFHASIPDDNIFSNYGGYLFSTPRPASTMFQFQPGSGDMSMGTTNRIIPTIGVQGVRSWAIPTPGRSESESLWIKTAPHQFTGRKNCHVHSNMSGQTGGIMGGINLPPGNSSYEFINCGTQLAGNNQHMMNATTTLSNSGHYLNASEYSKLQASSHQNVTQQHRQYPMQSSKVNQMAPLPGDSYAMNASDLMGSENFYGAASSGALLATKKLKGSTSELVSRKLIPAPGLPMQQHQQTHTSQQGRQLTVKGKHERQNQPELTVFGQKQEDTETRQEDETSKKEWPKQKHLPREQNWLTVNDAWNDNSLCTQKVNPEQSEKLHKQQILSSQEQQETQANNVHKNLSAQIDPEIILQGEQELHSQKKLQIPPPPQQGQPQMEQDLTQQHDPSQHILRNNIVSTAISQERCGTAGDNIRNAKPSVSAEKQKMEIVKLQKLLLYFSCASKCSSPDCRIRTGPHIAKYKLWAHIKTCHNRQCTYPYCRAALMLIRHHQSCTDRCCPVCGPLRQLIMKRSPNKYTRSSNPEAAELMNGVPCFSNFNSSVGININLLENCTASVPDMTQDEQPPMKRRKTEPTDPSCSQQEVRSMVVPPRISTEMQRLTQTKTQPIGNGADMLTSDSFESVPITSMHDRIQDTPPPLKWRKIRSTSSSCDQQLESTMVSVRSPSKMKSFIQTQTQLFQPNGHNLSMMKSDTLKTNGVNPALVTVEPSVRSQQGPCQKKFVLNKDTSQTPSAERGQKQGKPNKAEITMSLSADAPRQVNHETMKVKQESIMNVFPPDTSAPGNFGNPVSPKVKGVSLTELFTPEQMREHIAGLQKWADKSKAKAETCQSMERETSGETCQLCKQEKLLFDPLPIFCSLCPSRIKPNASCYCVAADDTRHFICIVCFNKTRCDEIRIDGNAYAKSMFVKEKNEEVGTEEVWVCCDNCKKWQHNICALFNGKKNDIEQAEYICPNCYIEQIKRGIRKPLPKNAILGAKDLPTTYLSDHIERRLCRQLKQERNERAKALGKSFDEVPGADALIVRVVSSVDKILKVKQQFVEFFQHEDYPTEFPYKSKALLLFQKIEGVDVCLFGIYVQEYGSECSHPNQRRIYLSYLDSVKYFRPDVKTVSGEALRTFVFHEILIGYLEYSKRRGFTSCYIWVSPPLDGDDYILYCHPEIQKTPNTNKLREWYVTMLCKASKEKIVLDVTNLYQFFFVSSGERKAKVTAARLPYFDGDHWPDAAEEAIMQFQQKEKNGQKHHKTEKFTTRRSLKATSQVEFVRNLSKDHIVTKKYRDTIRWSKENFIMVHLQHACTHCCFFVVCGKRWVCKQCKSFQLCDKCYESEQKLDQKQKHPIKSMEKHTLFPIEVTDVPADTKDKDDIIECEFFDTRHSFLNLCHENRYQYDTLRRAKHSSMMVLYHLHNRTSPAHLSVADLDAQNQEACGHGVQKLQKMVESLIHVSQCFSAHCAYQNCQTLKGLFRHGMNCKTGAAQGCTVCRKMWYMLQLHARACKAPECCVPRCKDLKNDMWRSQNKMDKIK